MGPLSTLAGRSPPAQSLFRPCPRPWHHCLNHPPAAPVPHPLLLTLRRSPPSSPAPPALQLLPIPPPFSEIRPYAPSPPPPRTLLRRSPGHSSLILAMIPSVSSWYVRRNP